MNGLFFRKRSKKNALHLMKIDAHFAVNERATFLNAQRIAIKRN